MGEELNMLREGVSSEQSRQVQESIDKIQEIEELNGEIINLKGSVRELEEKNRRVIES